MNRLIKTESGIVISWVISLPPKELLFGIYLNGLRIIRDAVTQYGSEVLNVTITKTLPTMHSPNISRDWRKKTMELTDDIPVIR